MARKIARTVLGLARNVKIGDTEETLKERGIDTSDFPERVWEESESFDPPAPLTTPTTVPEAPKSPGDLSTAEVDALLAEKSVSELTKPQLAAVIKARGLDVDASLNKDKLVPAVKAALDAGDK